jgi:hypothetical protein
MIKGLHCIWERFRRASLKDATPPTGYDVYMDLAEGRIVASLLVAEAGRRRRKQRPEAGGGRQKTGWQRDGVRKRRAPTWRAQVLCGDGAPTLPGSAVTRQT